MLPKEKLLFEKLFYFKIFKKLNANEIFKTEIVLNRNIKYKRIIPVS
jgi:hypothetical protein